MATTTTISTTPEWRAVWISMGAVIGATALLRITGLVDDFLLTLGKAVVPVIFFWLWNSTNEGYPRFAMAIAVFTIVWTGYFILYPVTLRLVTLDFPFTREAGKVNRADKDFRISEWLYPSGHEGRVIYRNLCQKEEFDKTKIARNITDPDKLWKRLEEIRVERQKCADHIVGEYHPKKIWGGLMDSFTAKAVGGGTKTNIANGLLFVGLLFGVGIGVCAMAGSGRSRFGEVAIIAGVIGTIYLAGSWLISLDASSLASLPSPAGAMSARTVFWILAGLILASILGYGIVRKRSPLWKMIFLIIVLLVFDWLWWQHDVSSAVLDHLKTVKWI